MADENAPNSAAEKDKAEGERESVTNRYDEPGGGDAGISNRPIDEEIANQDALPERGEEKDQKR
jgi:hypothetical protein